jgi:putative membrane protein
MHRWWDDMMWNGAPGVFMLVWLVFGLLLIALLVAGIVWLVRSIAADDSSRSASPGSGWGSTPGSAREELDRRYARGEITREEYRQIRDDLQEPGG